LINEKLFKITIMIRTKSVTYKIFHMFILVVKKKKICRSLKEMILKSNDILSQSTNMIQFAELLLFILITIHHFPKCISMDFSIGTYSHLKTNCEIK
jgi:hypothetical protein